MSDAVVLALRLRFAWALMVSPPMSTWMAAWGVARS
jgi:hypothetical protein